MTGDIHIGAAGSKTGDCMAGEDGSWIEMVPSMLGFEGLEGSDILRVSQSPMEEKKRKKMSPHKSRE